jgi:hypothetical protein
MLAVTYAECHIEAPYAKWRYAECRYVECRGTLLGRESLEDNDILSNWSFEDF